MARKKTKKKFTLPIDGKHRNAAGVKKGMKKLTRKSVAKVVAEGMLDAFADQARKPQPAVESHTIPPLGSTTTSEKPIVEPPPPPPPKTTADEIVEVCDGIKALLLRKNAAYGDSALKPMRVFSRATPVEQIMVRLDDKLSRLARGHALPDESLDDTLDDILGYLVLLKIAKRRDTLPFGSPSRL